MMNLISLRLKLEQDKTVPAPYAERWAELLHTTGPFDAPRLIFLAELLGLLDDDPAPQFTSTTYASSAFGVDERWEIRTRHVRLHREICETMSESWQSTETEIDAIEIMGLPNGLFLDWEGDWSHWPAGLTIGNLPAEQEPAILKLAQALFGTVTSERQSMSVYDSFRACLKRFPAEPFEPVEAELYIQALEDENDDVTLAALARLQRAGQMDRPAIRKAVLGQIDHWQRGTHVRSMLVKSLGVAGAAHNLAPLTRLLRDGNSSVEAAALEALAQIGLPEAMPAIGKCLRKTIYETRLAALLALEKLATPDQWPALIPYLLPVLRDETAHLRGIAVELLSPLDAPRLIRPFIAFLDEADTWSLPIAIAALGRWKAQAAVPKLRALQQSDAPTVRTAATEALAHIEKSQG
jgi:HEAT repeat protein